MDWTPPDSSPGQGGPSSPESSTLGQDKLIICTAGRSRFRLTCWIQDLAGVMGLVVQLVDIPQIWCIVTRLFMSPITSQSCVHYRTGRLGGYRLLDLRVIGAILIGLLVTGLCIGIVTGLANNLINFGGQAGQDPITSKNSKNYKDNYQGVLGMLRLTRTGSDVDRAELPLDSSDRTWTGYKK